MDLVRDEDKEHLILLPVPDSPVPGAPAFYSLKLVGGESHELSL
jgi:hypothetical protein